MFTTRTSALSASALLILALTACTTGGGDDDASGGSGGSGGDGSGGGSADCLADRTWVLDIDDSASQLATQLGSTGLTVTQSEGEGRQDFIFNADGSASAHIDVTYTVTVVQDELTLTLVQTHSGDPSGQWSREGDDVSFSDWDNAGYSVQNTMIVNGVSTESAINIPSEDLGDGSVMTVDCSGSTLTTKVSGSPYTHHWNAE